MTEHRAPASTLITGAEVVTLDASDRIGQLDVRIDDNRITAVGERLSRDGVDCVVEAAGLVAIPGFVQAHVHLCQTLFRAHADEMELLSWLRTRIWPMEGALSADDLRASARLAIAELLLGGTTAILDMGTVQHSDVLFEEAAALGLRYTGGKTIMDQGQGYPVGLRESSEQALAQSIRLCERWHGTHDGRLRYAFSPRFVLSCSEESMRRCVHEARRRGAMLHTHSSENNEEVELVRERTGMGNVEYLHSLGFSGVDVALAHGVWLSPQEVGILRQTGTHLVHCPSANLKLASGIARVGELLDAGVHIALGADGAPCNNRLDAFTEMRQAALLHKVRGGPTAVGATRALKMATREGALALGLRDVGRIDVGHKADLVLLDLRKPHTFPSTGDLISRIVYSAISTDVHSVFVDGKRLVHNHQLVGFDLDACLEEADRASRSVLGRIN